MEDLRSTTRIWFLDCLITLLIEDRSRLISWFRVDEYEYRSGVPSRALIIDAAGDRHVVDHDRVAGGLATLGRSRVDGDRTLHPDTGRDMNIHPHHRSRIRTADHANDSSDLDGGDASRIVQVALYGQVTH